MSLSFFLTSPFKYFKLRCMISRVIRLMISKTLSVSPARKLRSIPGLPHISYREMHHAHSALHTVFSITQSDHLITLDVFLAHGFRNTY
jgi:hypothetical protein